MNRGKFKGVATRKSSTKWKESISRIDKLYKRKNEIRSDFARDYTRILHSTAYRRMKHKTQVFFATINDHVCTRIEHVNHVNSISRTISDYIGLNSDLVDAISIGHDLGHAPFGHEGEKKLKEIIQKNIPDETFWHERNSLHFVDNIETLEKPDGKHVNLNLTYAVRDGIICHCGEVDDTSITPRSEYIDLNTIMKANQRQPFTWEGCVVKIADKIAYLGRDIEDAIILEMLEPNQIAEIDKILRKHHIGDSIKTNNTVLIHNFIIDLCKNSTPDKGIQLSKQKLNLMKEIKDYCYTNIYQHPKIEHYKLFVDHIIQQLFKILRQISENIHSNNTSEAKYYPTLWHDYASYIDKYSAQYRHADKYSEIRAIYDFSNPDHRTRACIDFISGMTDQYAIKKYKETITF